MKIEIVVMHPTKGESVQIVDTETLNLLAEQGVKYRLVDTSADQAPENIRVWREEDDLKLKIIDEKGSEASQEVVIEDYFLHENVLVLGEASDGSLYSYLPDASADLASLYESKGLDASLAPAGTAGSYQAWLQAIGAPLDTGSLPSSAIADGSGGFSFSNFGILGAVLGGAAGIAIAASGGGGSTATASGGATSSVFLGPVLAESGLRIEYYDLSGNLLGSGTIGNNSSFNNIDIGDYTGGIIARVFDANGNLPDYVDETTGAGVDLEGELLAVGMAESGNVTLNVTPLSTIAARALNITQVDGVGVPTLPTNTTLTNEAINTANQNVATAFGLSGDVTTIDITPSINQSGQAQTPNEFGRALQALSELDSTNGGLQENIESFLGMLAPVGPDGTTRGTVRESILATDLSSLLTNASSPAVRQYFAELIESSNNEAAIAAGVSLVDNADFNRISGNVPADATERRQVSEDQLFSNGALEDRVLSSAEITAGGNLVFLLNIPGGPAATVALFLDGRSVGTVGGIGDGLTWRATVPVSELATTNGRITDLARTLEVRVSIPSANTMGSPTEQTLSISYLVDNTNNDPIGLRLADPQEIAENSTASQAVSVGTVELVDPDGGNDDGYTFTLSGENAALFSIDETTGALSLNQAAANTTLDHETTPTLSVTVTATRGAFTLMRTFDVDISDVNEAPVFSEVVTTSEGFEPATETSPATIALTLVNGQPLSSAFFGSANPSFVSSFTDPDGDTLSFTYSNANAVPGLSVGADGSITGQPTTDTDSPVSLTVTASDGSLSSSLTYNITVVSAPAVTSFTITDDNTQEGGDNAGQAGSTLTYTLTLSQAVTATDVASATVANFDFGGTTATASFLSLSADGMSLTFTGTAPNGNATEATLSGITIEDGGSIVNTAGTNLVTTDINQTAAYTLDNTPPVIDMTTFAVAENTTIDTATRSVQLVATEANGDVTWGTTSNQFSLSSTGLLSFIGSADHETQPEDGFTVSVTAMDRFGNEDTQSITVNVTDVNEAPMLQPVADQRAVSGANFVFDASTAFNDVDAGDTLSFAATSLPAGYVISPTTGVISGMVTNPTNPSSETEAVVMVTATDRAGLQATQSFDLRVVNAPGVASITVADADTSTDTVAMAGDNLRFTLTLTEAINIELDTTTMPTAMFNFGSQSVTATLDTTTGFTGNMASNIQSLVFIADAPQGEATQVSLAELNLNGAATASTTTGRTLVTSSVGQSVGFTLDNTAPEITPTYSTNENTDPNSTTSGLMQDVALRTIQLMANEDVTWNTTLGGTDSSAFTLSDAGVLSFNAQANQEVQASYSVEVTATDTAGNSTTQTITVNVNDVNEFAPVLSQTTTNAPNFSNNTLTSVLVNGERNDFNFNNNFVDGDGNNTLSFTITEGELPAGLTLNGETGAVTGSTTMDGAFAFTVQASDGTSSQALNFTGNVVSAPTVVTFVVEDGDMGADAFIGTGGAMLNFTVGLSEPLTVSAAGTPQAILDFNGTQVTANLDRTRSQPESGSLVFTAAAPEDVDSTSVTLNSFNLNGATITGNTTMAALPSAVVGQTANYTLINSAPQAMSNINAVTNVDVQSNIVLEFGETVVRGTGNIRLVDVSQNGFRDDTTENTQDIDVTNTSFVTISGNRVIINPEFDLDFGSDYRIEVDAGAFTGAVSGDPSVAIGLDNAISFNTVEPNASGAASQRMNDSGDLVAGYRYVEVAGQGNGTTAAAFDANGADFAFVSSLLGVDRDLALEANLDVSNFSQDPTSEGALTIGDILYYDNQGVDNTDFYSSTQSNPATIAPSGDGDVNTLLTLSTPAGGTTSSQIEILGLQPVDNDHIVLG